MSTFDTIDVIIDDFFGITDIGKPPHYAHKESCTKLSNYPIQLNAELLLENLFSCITESRKGNTRKPSDENWRFKKKPNITNKNPSPEKTLEKAIVIDLNENWVNQVPTASGLYDYKSDKHRNIDLVHKLREKQYEFIELKVGSNNPLMAAIENLIYGVLYIFARLNLKYKENHELLQADKIVLSVLAPCEYYKGYNLGWLESALNSALKSFPEKKSLKCNMSFEFKSFNSIFTWTDKEYNRPDRKEYLLDALNKNNINHVSWAR